MLPPGDVADRLDRAKRYGFRCDTVPAPAYTAKPESHDDGPGHGAFLGPIGGPAFSRDLTGRFSRWHLQPGAHLIADVDAAFLAVRWSDGETSHCVRLRRDEATAHEVAALHPLNHEIFGFDGAPFSVVLTAFSPVLPGDETASATPAVVLDVHVLPLPGVGRLPAVDIALFWPNLNGWDASRVTSTDRGDTAWPGLHHAGNTNHEVPMEQGALVIQTRTPAVDSGAPEAVAVAVDADADAFTAQAQFRVDPMATGVPYEEQHYTLGAVYDAFARTGRLGATPDGSWEAHWHEPIGSAVAAHVDSGRTATHTRFVLGFDWPEVRFGQGRRWNRRYAGAYPAEGRARSLARRALAEAPRWLREIDAWHERTLGALLADGWPDEIAGCAVNELNLVVSLGSTWIDGPVDDGDPAPGPGRRAEHLGLLEGFDEGYFYYNTSDLWHFAFPALGQNWPRLAELIFADLGDVLDAEIPQRRPIYRPAEERPLLVADKLPHDLGNPLEDPFVRVNGYSMRDDPNTWRDSNPAFVLATLAQLRLTGREVTADAWTRLTAAAEVAAQQAGEQGVPRHDEFGDSTWDNLGLRGYSTYTTGLCAGMWSALARISPAHGVDPAPYERRRDASRAVLDELWNGRFFRAASEGKYAEAIMPDSLMGIFYAGLVGADVVPVERIRSHLRTAYEFAHLANDGGAVGPLLIAEEELREYERDGGQELQVNEVLIGSAWLYVAMLERYGLATEAREVASALRRVLYGGSGLQFRTPAAINARGRFRAPLNMRPLAVWWLAALSDA